LKTKKIFGGVMKYKYTIIAALLVIIHFVFICDLAKSDNNIISPKRYTIVSSKDLSIKALTKELSQYSHSELKSLPLVIRKEYRIVVPSDISKEELKASMMHLVGQETMEDPDIDAIRVFAYDRWEDVKSNYTFGKMEWCPYGIWNSVTPEIASTNDRSLYKYVFNISEKVDDISTSNMPTKVEIAIYDALEKELRANPNVDKKIIIQQVAEKFSISEEKLNKISVKVTRYKMR
jgi:hypothetical protein